MSPESIIGSIRSALSLHSIRSRNSPPDSKVSDKYRGDGGLDSSMVRFVKPENVATHRSDHEAHAEGLQLENIGERNMIPENRIMVRREFQADRNV